MQHIKTIQRKLDMKWVVAHLINDTQYRPLTDGYEKKADAIEEYRQQLLSRTRQLKTKGTWQRCECCEELTELVTEVDGLWRHRLCKNHNTHEQLLELFVLPPDFEEWRS
jgi:hypothetical protein